MRVLHITTIDIGGAFKGAWRLNESLKNCGVESQIMVRTKRGNQREVLLAFSSVVLSLISKIKNGINRLFARGEITRDLLGTDLSKNNYVKQADVIVLHWVNSFLSVRDAIKLGELGKPIIWIMHDMWLFTGGCHYDGYCGKFEYKCGNCPLISGKKERDISRKNFYAKMNMMEKLEVLITGPSEWIVERAKHSNILMGKDVCYIPNAIDTNFYCPIGDIAKLREQFHIDSSKKVILFGAADNGTGNEKKGFQYLCEAFKSLQVYEYLLIIFGSASSHLNLPEGLEVLKTGYISDEDKLIELYNVADVFVAPSNQEVFGYTVCEAMACGTPAVCFPVGGLGEQVLHKKNGYLAKYHDAKDLAQGIKYCVEHTDELGKEARKSALKYSYEKVGKLFADLCGQL